MKKIIVNFLIIYSINVFCAEIASNSTSPVFLQRIRNSIQNQKETSYSKLISNPSSINPQYAYNTFIGYDPEKKVIPNRKTPFTTSSSSAINEFFLKERYDEATISKIFQNLKAINPYTMLIDSPITFLKAEAKEPIPKLEVKNAIVEEEMINNPEIWKNYRFLQKTPLNSPKNEYFEKNNAEILKSKEKAEINSNNIFVIKDPPPNSKKKINKIEKIPVFVTIPIFSNQNVPLFEHKEYNQKIREVFPKIIDIPVEHQRMEPIPIIIQKEEKVYVPQQVPFGVKQLYLRKNNKSRN